MQALGMTESGGRLTLLPELIITAAQGTHVRT